MNVFNKMTALIVMAGFTFSSDVFAGRFGWGPRTQTKETESQRIANRKPNFNPFQERRNAPAGIQKKVFTRNANTPTEQVGGKKPFIQQRQGAGNNVGRGRGFSPLSRSPIQNQNNNTVGKSVTHKATVQPFSPISQNNNTVGRVKGFSPIPRLPIANTQPAQNNNTVGKSVAPKATAQPAQNNNTVGKSVTHKATPQPAQNNNTVGKSVTHKATPQPSSPIAQNNKVTKGKCISPITHLPVNTPLPLEKVVSKNPNENFLIKARDLPEEARRFLAKENVSLDSSWLLTSERIKEDLAELQAMEQSRQAPPGSTQKMKEFFRSQGFRG